MSAINGMMFANVLCSILNEKIPECIVLLLPLNCDTVHVFSFKMLLPWISINLRYSFFAVCAY
jgi:hypothetical protein